MPLYQEKPVDLLMVDFFNMLDAGEKRPNNLENRGFSSFQHIGEQSSFHGKVMPDCTADFIPVAGVNPYRNPTAANISTSMKGSHSKCILAMYNVSGGLQKGCNMTDIKVNDWICGVCDKPLNLTKIFVKTGTADKRFRVCNHCAVLEIKSFRGNNFQTCKHIQDNRGLNCKKSAVNTIAFCLRFLTDMHNKKNKTLDYIFTK